MVWFMVKNALVNDFSCCETFDMLAAMVEVEFEKSTWNKNVFPGKVVMLRYSVVSNSRVYLP